VFGVAVRFIYANASTRELAGRAGMFTLVAAVANSRAAETLASNQAAKHFLAIEAGCVLGDEGAEKLQHPFFAAPGHVVEHALRGEDGFQRH